MKRPELLAPVGNKECLVAAIEAGCDAVYLGGAMFGARSFAGNFTNDELVDAINYAHLYGVKVYVTTNIIIYENEVERFIKYIDFLYRNNADAVILQDIGMLDLIHKLYPNLELHASTQMHIHNIEGIKLAKKLGVKRCVIARECSIDQLKEFKENVDMDLEIFVHGALCISYSGQCLMSSMIGSRSGNRGTCAQSCRKCYNLISDNKKINSDNYLLSAKDLNTINNIGELIEIGIDSFKIEGRMKRPEYVYLVVSLYKKAIDQYMENKKINITEEEIIEMKKLFNREFTKGFLFNESNIVNMKRPNHMGIEIGSIIYKDKNGIKIKLNQELNHNDGIRIISDSDDIGFFINEMYEDNKLVKSSSNIVELRIPSDLKVGDKVLKTTDVKQLEDLNNKISNRFRRVLLNGSINIKLNDYITLELSDGINKVIVKSSDVVSSSRTVSATKEQIYTSLNKLNDTVYRLNKIDINMDDNLFVPVKFVADLRREAVYELNKLRMYQNEYLKGEYSINLSDYNEVNKLNVLIKDIKQYDLIKDKKIDEIYVDYNLYNAINDDRKVLKLPRVINTFNDYNNKLLVGELGSINKYSNCYTDFSLNVTNSFTVALLHSLGVNRITLSYELNDHQIKDIVDNYKKRYKKNPNLEVIVYAKEEVMVNKYNMLKEFNLKDKAYLEDEYSNRYLIYDEEGLMHIYNYKARNITDYNKYYNMGINTLRINLTDEDKIDEIFR